MQSTLKAKFQEARFLRLFPQLAGFLSIFTGLLVVIGWYAHWLWATRLLPGLPQVQYNTGLGLIFSGIALCLLAAARVKAAPWFGLLAAAAGTFTFLEYLTGWNLGIDQLLFTSYLPSSSPYPGRMSPLSSVCFICIGIGLTTPAVRSTWPGRLAVSGLLACVAMSVSLVALFGYALGIETATGWGTLTRISLNTAFCFLLLGSGLLIWSWRSALEENFNFLRWVPITGSATLIIMIGLVSGASLWALNDSIFWRGHTYRVLNMAGSFTGSMTDLERGMQRYVLTGDPAALDPYRAGTNNVARQLGGLVQLTRDNQTQQQRLKGIASDLDAVTGYSRQLLSTRDTKGISAAVQLEKTGTGLWMINRIRTDLRAFGEEEQRLLITRDSEMEADLHNTWRLIGLGSVLATALLVLANWMASREVRRRAQAEAEQQALNARLQETSALQNAILNSASYAVIATDADGRVRLFNPTAERMLGYSAAEIIGQQTPALWHDKDEVLTRSKSLTAELGHAVQPGFETFVAKARLGLVYEDEWTYIRKDGTRFPALLSVTGLKDGEKRISGFLGIIADITERRRAEEKVMAYLREVNELQSAMDEHAIVSIADPQGKITYANDKFCALSKYTRDEVLGRDHRIINSNLHSREFFREMWATISRGGVWKGEIRNKASDGTFYWVDATIVPFLDVWGKPRQYVAIRTEITNRKLAEGKLRESEERLRLIVDGVQDYAILMLDTRGKVTSWNIGAERIKGFSASEIIGQHFSRFYPPESAADGKPDRLLKEALAHGHVHDEGWRMRKDGSKFYASVLITAVRNEFGQHRGFAKVTRDITEKWLADERLKASEERFRGAFGDAPIGMALVSPEGRWLKVNRAICKMVGYKETELMRTDFQHLTHPEDLKKDLEFVKQMLAGKMQYYQLEKRYVHKDGHLVPVMLSVSLVRDGEGRPVYFISQIEDITERKRAEQKIADSLREKEALLREIHHRVKNNMQVISSILQLQSNYIKSDESLEVFRDCQYRIRTMALIHEKLYRSEGLAQIDFKEYLETLIGMLLRSHTGRTLTLRHELQIEKIALDVDTAIPLGLIANELVSNCLKHAFAGRQRGNMQVVLKRIDRDGGQLAVRDDGEGFPSGFDPEKTSSLGMRLVKILSSQIKGDVKFNGHEGAEVIVNFGIGAPPT